MLNNILPIQPIETPVVPGYHSNDNYSKPVEVVDPSSMGIVSTKDPIQEGLSQLANAKPDLYAPKQFDYDKANAEEFVGTKNYKALGFDPDLGAENELKYHQAQSAVDVIGDTISGFISKGAHGFVDLAAGWKNTAALFTAGNFGETFKRDEIEQAQKLEQTRENSYHIYTDPTDHSLFSMDKVAKGIQDAGGIVGAGAEMITEQLLITAAIAGTFGAAAPLEEIAAAKDAITIGEVAGESTKLMNTLDKPSNLKNVYNAFKESQEVGSLMDQTKSALKLAGSAVATGGDVIADGFKSLGIGKGILPGANSIDAIANGGLKTAIKSKNAGNVLASLGRGFGAFYNDVRDVNLAISMGQGSASGTYQQQLQELTEQYKHDNNEDPIGTDLESIKDKAYEASKTSGAFNALAAFYLNKLAFGNILTGSKATQEALLANASGEFSNLVRATTEKEFAATGDKLAMKEITPEGKNLWDNFRARAMRKFTPTNIKEFGQNALGHGLGFGLINTTQGALNEAVHSYYTAKYNHKAISAGDALQKGINSQFTKEGASSFIAGVVTGAIISPLMEAGGQAIERTAQKNSYKVTKPELPENATDDQKKTYEAQKTYYQQRTDPKPGKKAKPEDQALYNTAKEHVTNQTTPEEPKDGEDKTQYNKILETKKHIENFEDYDQRKRTAAQEYVDKVNAMWKNPLPGIGDVILQSQWNEQLAGGLSTNDKKQTEDAISDSGITLLVNAAQNGMIKPYLQHLDDKMSQLSPQELWDAIYANVSPAVKPQFTEEGHAQLLQKIQDFKNQANGISKIYANLLKQFPPAINPNRFALGSDERKAAQQQYDQHLRALGLISYYKASVVDKLERQNKILFGDSVSGGIQEHVKNMPFFNVKSFGSVPDMTEEINLLTTLTASERIPGNDKAYKYTAEMGAKLKNYRDTVQEYIDKYNNILANDNSAERDENLKELKEYYYDIFEPLLKDLINNKLLELDVTGRNQIKDWETLEKITKGYMDYHLLTAEHDNMLDTVNKVLDPNGKHDYFRSFIDAEDNAMAWEAYKAQKAADATKPVDITPKEKQAAPEQPTANTTVDNSITPETNQESTSTPVNTTTPVKVIPKEEITPVTKPEEPITPIAKNNENAIHKELLDRLTATYSPVEPGEEENVVDDASKEYIDYMHSPEGKDLSAKMDASFAVINNKPISVEEKNKQILAAFTKIINDHFDNNQSIQSYPNLKNNPHVVKLADNKYQIATDTSKQNGKIAFIDNQVYSTPGQANKALTEYINKEHPEFAVGESTYRNNQFLYDDKGTGHLLFLKKGIPYLDNAPTDEAALSKFHKEKPTDVKETAEPISSTPITTDNFQKITKLNDRVKIFAHTSIGKDGLEKLVRDTPEIENVITLTLYREEKVNQVKYEGDGDKRNPYIKRITGPYSVQINIDNINAAAFIPTASDIWTFDGKQVSVPNLTIEQFKKGYAALDGNYEKALATYKSNYANQQTLLTAVGEFMKNKNNTTISNAQLKKFITIIPWGNLDFINAPEEKINRPTLQKMEETGSKIISIINDGTGEVVYGDTEAHKSMYKSPSVYTNYRAIVDKNGQRRWIQVQGKRYTPEEMNSILSQITIGVESLKELEGKKLLDAKKSINKLLRKVFIAVDPGPGRIIIEPQIAISKGVPTLQISVKFRDKSPVQGIPDAFLINMHERDFLAADEKSIEQYAKSIEKTLNAFFNKKGGNNSYIVSIKPDSFRQSFDSNFDEDVAMQLQSSVSTNVTRDNYLIYKTIDSTIPEEIIPPVVMTIPNTDNAETRQPEVTQIPAPESNISLFHKALETGNTEEAFDALLDEDDFVEKIESSPTESEIISINQLREFLENVIPTGLINVEDVGRVIQKLQNGNATVGQFITHINTLGAKGTIQTSEDAPYKYHEAIHGIFRLLLPDSKIEELLNDAKQQSPITQEKIDKFLEERPRFIGADRKTIEDRIAEEFIADTFDAWKKDHKTTASPAMKSFFAKLWDWIKALFNRIKGDNLEAFFYDVNRGAYKNAKLQDNQFTSNADITERANKIIEIGKTPEGFPKTLNPEVSNQITGAIAALYIQHVKSEAYQPREVVLNKILNMYKDMLYPKQERYVNTANGIKNIAQRELWMKDLVNRYQVFNKPEARQSVLDAVNDTLRIWGIRKEMETDNFEELENSETREKGYDKIADEIGGYENMPAEVKMYISSVTFPYTDEFGNTELVKGVPLIQPVNGGLVYNGLLQTLEGCVSDNDVIQRLLAYKGSKSNPDTSAFINRLLEESGFSEQGDGKYTITKNQSLFQSVINTFKQFNTNALFGEVSPQQGSSRVYNANQQDSARSQFSQWAQAHEAVYMPGLNNLNSKADKKQYAIEALTPTLYAIKSQIATKKAQGTAISDDDLGDISQEISNELKDRMGIAISPDTIAYSIVSGKDGEVLSKDQMQLVNAYRGKAFITVEDIDGIKDSMLAGDNVFTNKEGEREGAANRLLKLAQVNIPFDQTVWTMSYIDPEGKTRWGLQKPTYNRQAVQKLNDDEHIANLKISDDAQTNYLLSNDDFLKLSNENLLKVSDISGLKQVTHNISEGEDGEIIVSTNRNLEVNKQKGSSFGSLTARDFKVFTLAAYGSPTKVQKGSEKDEYFFTTPVSLGIIAESSTNNMVNLPVFHSMDGNDKGETKLSQEALDVLTNKVFTEVSKIQRVVKEIATLKRPDQITDYHNGALRGTKLIDTRDMIGSTLADEIEKNAQENENYVPDIKELETKINQYWNKNIDEFIDDLEKEGLIKTKKGKIENVLLPDFIFNGFQSKKGLAETEKNEKMNLIAGNVKHNLGQIYMNHYINGTAIRQLLYGDSSRSWKNVISTVRSMMKGANNAGESLEFTVTAPDLGIDHPLATFHHALIPEFEYTTPTGELKDEADGQMYTTVKGLRYALFGFGELTKTQADILDAITKGSDKAEGMFIAAGGLKKFTEAFDPKKVTYADGQTHFKCTILMLTKELTSYKEKGKWLPLLGKENLHHLRESMEAFENQKELEGKPTISFTSTANSSKGLKFQTAPGIQNIHSDYFHELPAANMRQVLKLGSNKLQMTDPNGLKFNALTEQDHNAPAPWLNQTIGEVAKDYLKDTAQRSTNSYHGMVNSMFKTKSGKPIRIGNKIDLSDIVPDLGMVTDQMRSTQEATGSDSQILEILTTRDGEQIYNWNLSPVLPKTTQMSLSYMGTGPLKEKVPGLSLVMASGYGMQIIREVHSLDDDGQPKTWTVHTTAMFKNDPEEYANVIRHDNPLEKNYNNLPDPTKNKVYVLDGLRHNYPEYDADGKLLGYFTECIRPAHFTDEAWGKVVPSLQNIVGTRIPWDDKHQVAISKVVDILPAYYGSIVICPGLIDHTSGSDKDGDKMFGSIQDTYIKNGVRVPYGTAITPEEKFAEYKLWQKTNNKLFKRLYNNDELYSDEEGIATLLNDKDANDFRAEQVLKQLRLPSTLSEFEKEGSDNLNNGVLNNRIFNQKIALLSNEHIAGGGPKAIINQATDTSPIKSLLDADNENSVIAILRSKGIDEENPIMKQLLGSSLDINTINGAAKMMDIAHEGKEDVGAAIISVMTGGLLQQYDIHGKGIVYNDRHYTSFGNQLNSNGVRKLSETSALANTMTDNLKDGGTAAKLGLTIDAVGIIGTMVMQGIPLKDAIWYTLQPAVQNYFKQMKSLTGTIKTVEERAKNKSTLLDNMLDKLEQLALKTNPNKEAAEVLGETLSQEKLIDAIVNGGKDIKLQYAALRDIADIQKEVAVLSAMNKVMTLSKGLPASWEDFDKIDTALEKIGIIYDKETGLYTPISEEAFQQSKIPVDVRAIFTDKHDIYKNYLQQLAQEKELSKKVFLERTDVFNRVYDIVSNNFDVPRDMQDDFKKEVKQDFISYLSILTHINTLKTEGGYIGGLRQGLIYDTNETSIKDIIVNARKLLKGKNTNMLISKFLRIVAAGEEGNRDNLNKATTNSWAKLSQLQQQQLQDDWYSLFTNAYKDKDGKVIETREIALTLFQYLLVKDGGQFKSGSFIRTIATFMFKDLSDATKKVLDLLSNENYDEQKAIGTLGVSYPQVLNNFMKSYTSHTSNSFFIKEIRQPQFIPLTKENAEIENVDWDKVKSHLTTGDKPVTINTKTGNVTLNLFRGIRENKSVEVGTGIVTVEKGKKFTPTETEMMKKNIAYIESAGFIVRETKEGYKVQMPFSIKIQGNRYELKQVGKVQSHGIPTRVIEKGEDNPQGISGWYQKAPWYGSEGQWKGALYGLFGDPKEATVIPGTEQVSNPGYSPSSPAQKEVTADIKTEPQTIDNSVKALADTGVFTTTDKKGNIVSYNDKGEVINTQKNALSLSGMKQPDLFTQSIDNQSSVNDIHPPYPGVEKANFTQYEGFSGAADGSDKEWAAVGKKKGIGKWTDYVVGHMDKLTPEQKTEVENAYNKAANDLGRPPIASNTYAGKLVRRDYLQAKAADALFAIGNIVKPGDTNKKGYKVKSKTESVDGGTGYSVQMAINLGKEVHVFDQNQKQWYKWNGDLSKFLPEETPILTRKFAGVGTREITDAGKQAIKEIYQKTQQNTKVDEQKETLPLFSSASIVDNIDEYEDYSNEEDSTIQSAPKQIDWKVKTELIWKSKKLPADKKAEWLQKARGVYVKMNGKFPDNEILDAIKNCI